MNRLSLGLTLVLVLFLSGCATPRAAPPMYYWAGYSTTLYNSKKTPSDASILTHQKTLELIIKESKTRNLRIPPGVYAELGYIYLKQSNNQLAIQYFKLEREIYPESTLLMQRLENVALTKDNKPEDKTTRKEQPETKSEK